MIVRAGSRRAGPIGRAALVSASVLILGVSTVARAEGKFALVIGTNSYPSIKGQFPELLYPEKDVDDLTLALEGEGFKVKSLKDNGTRRESIIRELTSFASRLTKDDTFLLAFSGHGVRNEPVNKETYWLTYDTQLESLDVAGIRLKHLLDYVQEIPASKKLVLLDHCYSGNITLMGGAPRGGDLDAAASGTGGTPRGPAGTVGLEARGQAADNAIPAESADHSGGLVLLAASYGFAFESAQWEHGIFTKAVIEAIRDFRADQGAPVGHGDGDGQVSVMELIAYVEDRVPDLARELHISQIVVPRQSWDAIGLAKWIIAKTRPIPKRDDMTRWSVQGWMTVVEYTKCVELFDLADESGKTHVALTTEQERKMQLIREVFANPGLAERAKARAIGGFCNQ